MAGKTGKSLHIITVMNPVMCLMCNNAHIADVKFTDGSMKKMFYCDRGDCDNWIYPENDPSQDHDQP